MKQFRLNSKKDANRIIMYLNTLEEPFDYLVKIIKNKSIRSLKQNNLYWALNAIIAEHCGYEKQELHFIFMNELFGKEIQDFDGDIIRFVPSSANLKTNEFAELIRHCYIKEVEFGLYLPDPREFGLLNQDYR